MGVDAILGVQKGFLAFKNVISNVKWAQKQFPTILNMNWGSEITENQFFIFSWYKKWPKMAI